MMGTDTSTYTIPPHTSSSNDTRTGAPTGTGASGLPFPTGNSTCAPCSTRFGNITVTITAFSTSTEVSTFTDVQSAILFKNQTVTVTEGTVTVTEDGTTVTEPGATITLPGYTLIEEGETVTVTEPGTTTTLPGYTFIGEGETVTEVITEPAETSTVTVTLTTITTEGRNGPWYRAGRG
jgi:hypothetical protein